MSQHKKHLQELYQRFHEVEIQSCFEIQRFVRKFQNYGDTYQFEKFKKDSSENNFTSLKQCETIFDGNYETILRNVELISCCKKVSKQLEFLTKFTQRIIKQCEDDNNELILYNNQLIEEMKKIEDSIRSEEIEKNPSDERKIEAKYNYNLSRSYNDLKMESVEMKAKREKEEHEKEWFG